MLVLVTGGAGYIGSHTCVKLLERGHNVVIVDDLSNSTMETLFCIKAIVKGNLRFHKINILDKEKMEIIFQKYEFDIVIHFAGFKCVEDSINFPLKYYYNNIVGTFVLCELMEKYNIKKLIFSSSATVYGMVHESPLKESLTLDPINPYGKSKMMVEQALHDIYNADKTWSIVILRYFNPVGTHYSGKMKEVSRQIPTNLFYHIIQVVMGKENELKIYGNNYETHDGTGMRDFIHVEDLAEAHVKAIEKLKKSTRVSIYNIGTGIGYTVFDVVKCFESFINNRIPYRIMNRRLGDVGISYADSSKAYNELNWKAKRTLHDICKSIVMSYR